MYPTEATELVKHPLPRRRLPEPPGFWWRLATGSVAVHVLVLAIAFPWLRASLSQAGGGNRSPVAVDLVEISPDALAAIETRGTPAQQPAAAQATAPVAAPQTAPANPAPPRTSVPQEAIPEFAPSVPPLQEAIAPSPAPPLANLPLRPSALAEGSAPPRQSTPLPLTTSPETQAPQPPTNVPPANVPPASVPPTRVNRQESAWPGSDAEGSIGDEAADRIAEGDLNHLPEAPVVGQLEASGRSGSPADLPGVDLGAPGSVGFSASVNVAVVPPSEDPRDPPDVAASPRFTTLAFTAADALEPNACPFDPMTMNERGASVSFQVVVEADGRVSQVFLRDATASAEYVALAQCLIQRRWEFNPATSENGAPVASSNLIVTITIN